MAVSLLGHEVSDLCLGKPALRSLFVASTTVGDALSALKRSGEACLSVWTPAVDEPSCVCVGKVCLVDVICFLAGENLKDPASALQKNVSCLLPNKAPGIVRHLDPHASLLEAIDLILEGAQNLVIPIHSPFTRKRPVHKPFSDSTLQKNNRGYCWLTQEDVIRYLLNSIGLFSPIANQSIESLGIIDSESILAIHYFEPASSALPLIFQSHIKQTSVAVLDCDEKLVGEISPHTLNNCDETVAAAIAVLSVGDLMAYIDCGEPPEDILQLVKERLEQRNLHAALELMEDDSTISCVSSTCSSYSSSSDDEFGSGRSGRLSRASTRAMKSTEAIVCYPWSSLVAVMIQAISHRLSYVWVVEEDGSLVGVVTFAGMLEVFRERLKLMV